MPIHALENTVGGIKNRKQGFKSFLDNPNIRVN